MHLSSIIFTISGTIGRKNGRGRELGFATANLEVDMETPEGLFFGYTQLKERKLPSLIFIGSSITFGETDKKAEVYILDFDEDIYDEYIDVSIHKKLRDNKKFDSAEELIEQMKKDELEARTYF